MLEEQLDILKIYMKENGLLRSECLQHPLFTNCWGEKLTRAGLQIYIYSVSYNDSFKD